MVEEKSQNNQKSARPEGFIPKSQKENEESSVGKDLQGSQEDIDETEPQYKLEWKKPVIASGIVFGTAIILWIVLKLVIEK